MRSDLHRNYMSPALGPLYPAIQTSLTLGAGLFSARCVRLQDKQDSKYSTTKQYKALMGDWAIEQLYTAKEYCHMYIYMQDREGRSSARVGLQEDFTLHYSRGGILCPLTVSLKSTCASKLLTASV